MENNYKKYVAIHYGSNGWDFCRSDYFVFPDGGHKVLFDKLSDALIVAENWENENGDEVWVCGVIDKYPYYEKVVKI